MRSLASAFVLAALCALASCTDDGVGDAVFAIDADHSGTVDCADLDHVLACIHDPASSACDDADVNGDGVVDDTDVHDLHHGLQETGHHCAAPEHHDAEGDHTGEHP